MKSLLLFISFSCSLSFAISSSMVLREEAIQSLDEYFKTTDRKIQKLKWIDLSLIDPAQQQYLLQAEVLARKNGHASSSYFHCGVFSKKWSPVRWEVALTSCEGVPGTLPYGVISTDSITDALFHE